MYQVKNKDFRERVLEKLKLNTFAVKLGFSFDLIEPGKVSGKLTLDDWMRQQDGWAHGAVLMTLCDITAGFAAYTLVSVEELVVTAQLSISCMRPAKSNVLYGTGWVVKAGKNLYFCESEVYSESKELLAKATSVMGVI